MTGGCTTAEPWLLVCTCVQLGGGLAIKDHRVMIEANEGLQKNVINFELRRRQLLAGEVSPPPPQGIPDFISQSDISTLSDDQLDQLINLIRLRRLNSTLQYERTMREKEQLTLSKAREQLEKKCVQVWKELDRSLTILEKLELRINEMRALRIQVGLDF